MIEQIKQFADRQTPVSLLLAVVGVIFTVMTCIEALQLGVLILMGILRPVWTVFGGSFLTEGFTNSGILSFQFFKILIQALLLVLLRHFLW
jgi:hypothetical protein